MESSDPTRFMEDLLNFGSGEKDEEESPQNGDVPTSFTQSALGSALLTVLRPDDCSGPFADSPLIEEELEWISNKDAFPAVETFPGFLPSHYDDDIFLPAKQSSPVSVLQTTTSTVTSSMSSGGSHSNSSIVVNCEKKARSKRRASKQPHCSWYKHHGIYATQAHARRASSLGRKCQHCGVEKTPQWRKGPNGPKTLCNACGVRYKSGRLVPEYRPANSPTFCSELHSNSHRKVVEMRMRKEMIGKGVG